MIEQLAVVVYGALTIIIAVVFAYMQHSALGMALIFAAAGTTYLFQFAQLALTGKWIDWLIVLSILLTIASAIASFAGI
jgi:hypothetical protein